MAQQKPHPTLHEIVARARKIESTSGYLNDSDAEQWALHGRNIDFGALADLVTSAFRAEIKKIFADLVDAKQVQDGTIVNWFSALKDCLHHVWRTTGRQADGLSGDQIEAWRKNASGVSYQQHLKLLILNARARRPNAFPDVSDAVLSRLKRAGETEHVLNLNPDKGPWLEAEVMAQDVAIEAAYTSGTWTSERYVLVQLLRHFGMRIGSLSRMKVGDVHLPITGHDNAEIRWPFLKNAKSVDHAPFWPIGGTLRIAFENYLERRLTDIPRRDWFMLPFFTPKGLPGSFKATTPPRSSLERGYEGHVMEGTLGKRFVSSMTSLQLLTYRTGEAQPMKFTTHRERHTVGTRLALKGYGAQQIAFFLGHTDVGSCDAYVDLARLCMQLRDPVFFRMMDKVGSLYSSPCVTRLEIEAELHPVISMEASTSTTLAVIGGGRCGDCMFAGSSTAAEPWPCLSCPRFHLFEDADLQALWDILQDRKAYMTDAQGRWSDRFDPDIFRQFQRYEAMLVGAEMRRRDAIENRSKIKGTA